MVIRLQVGTLHFIWMADMLDRELSVTMDCWRAAKVVPVVLGIESGSEWNHRFFLPEMPEGKSLYDGLSQRMGDVPSKNSWSNMVSAATRARPGWRWRLGTKERGSGSSSPRVRCLQGRCHPTRGRGWWARMS